MLGLKKLLQLTRENPVPVSIWEIGKLVLRWTKDNVKNCKMEKVMRVFCACLFDNKVEFNSKKRQLCQYVCKLFHLQMRKCT